MAVPRMPGVQRAGCAGSSALPAPKQRGAPGHFPQGEAAGFRVEGLGSRVLSPGPVLWGPITSHKT